MTVRRCQACLGCLSIDGDSHAFGHKIGGESQRDGFHVQLAPPVKRDALVNGLHLGQPQTSAQNAQRRLVEYFPVMLALVHTTADIKCLRDAGYHAFLIGESLMQAERPGEKLKELLR